MPDVSLVYLPFGSLERPSLALGLLKTALTEARISCDVNYCNFDFAERIGLELYGKLAWVREEMIGEWIFSGAAFPEFKPDVEGYLDSVLDSFYPTKDGKEREFGRSYLLFARHEAEAFIESLARSLLNERPHIVACSSTFNQNCAMLALTRRIKQLDPEVVTVVGGANCEGAMGSAMARCFPWLDFIGSGEAELFFPELCQQILDKNLLLDSLPYGVISRHAKKKNYSSLPLAGEKQTPPRAMLENLEASPVPDFDDYFEALERYSARDYITPGLVLETARGCWWGAMHHCTFCGLNGGTMKFRSKTPDRVQSELRHLSSKYGVNRFMMADNILDQNYYKDLLPALGTLPEKYDLYFEIKSNVTFSQLQTLKAAGVGWIVAGIESLHDEVLRLMDKGTWAWLNLQMLKWTRGLGIHVSWNMLCGLPGEEDFWYGEMADWLPLVYHLEPPNDMRIIRFDRFSPYQARPEQYGLKLRPSWPYAHIYPLSEDELQHLVYFFETEGRSPVHINPFRQLRTAEGLPSLGGPGRDRLQQRIHEWVRLYRSSSPAILHMTEGPESTTIVDTRPVATDERHVLKSLARRVHRACDRASTQQSLLATLANDGGPTVGSAQLDHELSSLVERRLVIQLGQRYLALAVHGLMPTLPWKNQDGYPGGWFVYPRPMVIPAGLEQFLNNEQVLPA